MIDILPPNPNIDINARIRIQVLAGVLDELTKVCGVNIEKDIQRGIVDRDILKAIRLTFKDSKGTGCGRIRFDIDWDKIEILIREDTGSPLFEKLDFSQGLCSQLDKRLLNVITIHMNKLRKEYNIVSVDCTFVYRSKYTQTSKINKASMEYMGHVYGTSINMNDDIKFKKSLTTALQGLDGILHITIDCD